MSRRFPAPRGPLAAALAVAVVAGSAVPAAAHVTAQPPEQPAGSFTKVVFRAPNERAKPTVRLRVQLPPELDFVKVQPVTGWRYAIKRKKLPQPREVFGSKVTDYVSEIEWTGGRIGAEEFQEFPVSMKLPDKGTFGPFITFSALQYYAGGETVRWIQKPEAAEGNWDELETPAARVELVSPDAEKKVLSSFATQDHVDDEVSGPRTMSTIGIIAGGLALLLGAAALGRRRST